jgi:hypothetical protein
LKRYFAILGAIGLLAGLAASPAAWAARPMMTAGIFHACALSGARAVQCWGYNVDGLVGNGTTTTPVLAPVTVTGLAGGVIAIAADGTHTCALTNDWAFKCWGDK